MRVKMTDKYKFIIQKPWLLEEYNMSALEREMIVRLSNDKADEMFPFKSVHELLINTLNYYKEQKVSFNIEVYGLPSAVRMRFVSLLASAIGIDNKMRVGVSYSAEIPHFILNFNPEVDAKGNFVTGVVYFAYESVEDPPALVLELLGYKEVNKGLEYLTVLYDRQQHKHGFVRFVDGEFDLVKLESDLMLQHLLSLVTRFDLPDEETMMMGSLDVVGEQEEEGEAA